MTTVRSFDFLDLPFLSRYRQDLLPLDSARLLTRGNPLGAAALLAHLDPRRHTYTGVASTDGATRIGQIILDENETCARLTFLAPAEHLDSLTSSLLDHLSGQAGVWGAFYLLAEVEEEHPAFRFLRQAGFVMHASQRVWKLNAPPGEAGGKTWQEAQESDWLAVQSLHAQIVPALLQPVENLRRQAGGWVCRLDGSLQAYVTVRRGRRGIWLKPLAPPESGCGPERLTELVRILRGQSSLPVYVCVRSYQAWLESLLADLGAEPGPSQALMVRRLGLPRRAEEAVPSSPEKIIAAKPAAPVTRIESK
jgi:hypothetical protein